MFGFGGTGGAVDTKLGVLDVYWGTVAKGDELTDTWADVLGRAPDKSTTSA